MIDFKWIGRFGDMLQDHVEKSHQEGEKHDQTVARLSPAKARAASFSHHEKTANAPKVLATEKQALETTPRKRKSTCPSLATGNRIAKKQARDIQRSVNLSAEQIRPSGEQIQPHGTSSRNSRITVLKFNSVVTCSSC
jgi:hypothetical protein